MSRLPDDFSASAQDRDPAFELHERDNPIPWPLIAVVLALVVWGAVTLWLDAQASETGTAKNVADPGSDQTIMESADGATLFGDYCATCHQANGSGIRAAIPPLDGSRYVTADADVPITILLRGIAGPIEVKGEIYTGRMPTFGPTLDDGQIARILTYIRASWSNSADEISPDQVAARRAGLGDAATLPLDGGSELEELFAIPTNAPAPEADR
ncbi:mono/diheme cytochrome c family protein [Palleronia aestuarii]|uniref:Mono/diheme cytochrome c family protein n=1 Tax=Palleronia aestuarii TaxID=568105 RepID=A0A2W7NNG2_9RHOB|nr:cytochrome c [Palleronia aestuarii]PZX12802.1 mono/diheme cytochrome c family protein [Palleronia aestuarii]